MGSDAKTRHLIENAHSSRTADLTAGGEIDFTKYIDTMC